MIQIESNPKQKYYSLVVVCDVALVHDVRELCMSNCYHASWNWHTGLRKCRSKSGSKASNWRHLIRFCCLASQLNCKRMETFTFNIRMALSYQGNSLPVQTSIETLQQASWSGIVKRHQEQSEWLEPTPSRALVDLRSVCCLVTVDSMFHVYAIAS